VFLLHEAVELCDGNVRVKKKKLEWDYNFNNSKNYRYSGRSLMSSHQQAKLRAIFSDLQRALGMRVAQAVGTRKTRAAGWTWWNREGE